MKQWQALINELDRFFRGYKPPVPPPPKPIEPTVMCVTPRSEIEQFFNKEGLAYITVRDNWFWGPADISVWIDWAFEALLTCPPYQADSKEAPGFDCDDFASVAVAHCKRKYKANKEWVVEGYKGRTRHQWFVVKDATDFYEIEPQTGEAWVFGTNKNYKADKRL